MVIDIIIIIIISITLMTVLSSLVVVVVVVVGVLHFRMSLKTKEITTCAAEQTLMRCAILRRSLLK